MLMGKINALIMKVNGIAETHHNPEMHISLLIGKIPCSQKGGRHTEKGY